MVVMPPRELNDLVRIENGEFKIDDSANDEQKTIFLDWVKEIKELEADE